MPYIVDEKRQRLDPSIERLHKALVDLQLDDEENNMEGNINYALTRLLMMVYGDKEGTWYAQINDAMGVLECVKQEFYRKVAAPYEDQKEFDNGEVRPFRSEPEIIGGITVDEEQAVREMADQLNRVVEKHGLFVTQIPRGLDDGEKNPTE